jgi:hypothetical protein
VDFHYPQYKFSGQDLYQVAPVIFERSITKATNKKSPPQYPAHGKSNHLNTKAREEESEG